MLSRHVSRIIGPISLSTRQGACFNVLVQCGPIHDSKSMSISLSYGTANISISWTVTDDCDGQTDRYFAALYYVAHPKIRYGLKMGPNKPHIIQTEWILRPEPKLLPVSLSIYLLQYV